MIVHWETCYLLLMYNWFDQNIKSLNNVNFWNQELKFEHVSTTKKRGNFYN
jgi:hypothetical protein